MINGNCNRCTNSRIVLQLIVCICTILWNTAYFFLTNSRLTNNSNSSFFLSKSSLEFSDLINKSFCCSCEVLIHINIKENVVFSTIVGGLFFSEEQSFKYILSKDFFWDLKWENIMKLNWFIIVGTNSVICSGAFERRDSQTKAYLALQDYYPANWETDQN